MQHVFLKALPPDLALPYQEQSKESAEDTAPDDPSSVSDDTRPVQNILEFLRIHVEISEEGWLDHTDSQHQCSLAVPACQALTVTKL